MKTTSCLTILFRKEEYLHAVFTHICCFHFLSRIPTPNRRPGNPISLITYKRNDSPGLGDSWGRLMTSPLS